jgi:hypothetical protein
LKKKFEDRKKDLENEKEIEKEKKDHQTMKKGETGRWLTSHKGLVAVSVVAGKKLWEGGVEK